MNADNDARPRFMRFVRTFAWPIIIGWLLLTVALNVLVPPIESVARNHAVTMSPQDAPAMIAAKRMGATFHESDSDSIAMIVLESDKQLGDEAHRVDGFVAQGAALVAGQVELHVGSLAVLTLDAGGG
ncbi:hypothetical protein A9X02_19960 [Mycobacterium malmoense]|nr:hypothetical protein A9X02_19960 [Mycobacterium malmoense]